MTKSTSWREDAACRGLPVAPWFADRRDRMTLTLAQELCEVCPVRALCLDHALDTAEKTGVWGGMTPAERAAHKLAGGPNAEA